MSENIDKKSFSSYPVRKEKRLNINKVELQEKFKSGDTKYLIAKAYEIAGFVVNNSQSGIYLTDREQKEDMIQECVAHFSNNLNAGKINPNKNIFSFIWISSKRKVLEHLRLLSRRNRIRRFESLDFQMEEFKIDFENADNEFLADQSLLKEDQDYISFNLTGTNKVITIKKEEFRNRKALKNKLLKIKQEVYGE